ncbi:EpsG family protein [Flavobacterium sp. LT1R49]|uniref:EpsG family protein n=1 Tax=Flavobacterium arabinosi TaxID=3398737 RepID=UPI003A872C88
MLVYYVVLFFSSLLAFVSEVTKSKFLWIVSLLTVSFFAGLRYFVGIDYESYTFIFASISDSKTEPAFRIINLIIFFLGLNVQFVFLISSLITFSLFYKGIKRYSDDVFLSVFLLLFCGIFIESLNIIRQYIAISIFFYGIKYIINKNLIKYIICIALATSFHYSAILLILAYFVLNNNIGKLWFPILCVAYLLPFILPIQSFFGLIPGYDAYFSSGNVINNDANASAELGVGFLSKLLIGFSCLFYYDRILRLSKESKLYLNGFFIYLFLLSFFRDFMVMVRLGYYFNVFLVLLIPKFFQVFDKKTRLILYILFIVYGFAILLINLLDTQAKLVPYNYQINFFE